MSDTDTLAPQSSQFSKPNHKNEQDFEQTNKRETNGNNSQQQQKIAFAKVLLHSVFTVQALKSHLF